MKSLGENTDQIVSAMRTASEALHRLANLLAGSEPNRPETFRPAPRLEKLSDQERSEVIKDWKRLRRKQKRTRMRKISR